MIERYGFLFDDIHILPIMKWVYLSFTHKYWVNYTKKYTFFLKFSEIFKISSIFLNNFLFFNDRSIWISFKQYTFSCHHEMGYLSIFDYFLQNYSKKLFTFLYFINIKWKIYFEKFFKKKKFFKLKIFFEKFHKKFFNLL